MFFKTFRSKISALTLIGLTFLAPSGYAAYNVTDAAQKPLAALESANTLLQQLQFFDVGSTARSIYTLQGDVRDLQNKWGGYLRDFNWYVNAAEKENYKPMIEKILYTGQQEGVIEGGTTAAVKGEARDAATLKRNIERVMMMPEDPEDAIKMTDQAIKSVKTAQRMASRTAVLNGYSLALATQEEAANFEAEKLPAVRQMSNSPESLTEGVAAQTESLNLIASQININNLLKASSLEMLSTEALKQMDG